MDPEEIARLVNEMKLSRSDPKEIVNLEEAEIRIEEERLSRCLVAKVLLSKAINRDAFRQQLPRILQAERRMNIEATGDNTFVFEFYSIRDRNRALNEGPWNFSRNLLICKEPTGLNNPRSMLFEEINIWVQLHNIPLAFLQKDLLMKLGRQIGQIVELDRGENGAFLGRFARIRVRINITKQLRKCLRISAMRDEEDTIILLVYERLPDFCYACGRLGHSCRECDDEDADKVNHSFGVWMRASSHAGGGRSNRGSGVKHDETKNAVPTQDESGQTKLTGLD
ncbi:uncharacterized protein LOC142528125 [Primulina tabacum]|uniref:uncharacterized protein LOC142528125 n=1 Tax=Primulina tabacum TaxID=48773 RepID=UPI003F5A9588